MPINVMIVDDIPEISSHFSFILQNEKNIRVVGIASKGSEAVKMARELKPDVILMDIQMETDNAGLLATQKIMKERPETKIIMLTIHDSIQNITEAYMYGAVDYILKTSSVREIIDTVFDAVNQVNFSNTVTKAMVNEMMKMKKAQSDMIQSFKLLSNLSKSDLEIIELLCQGKKYKEIAKERYVEEVSIRSRINKISKKLNGTSIRDLVDLLNSCSFFEAYHDKQSLMDENE